MDYNRLSDHEINKLVAYHLGYTQQGRGWIDNADGIYWYMLNPEEGYRYSLHDYCNSWGDAGPIIEENKLWLREISGYWVVRAFPGRYSGVSEISWSCSNPLRAAMVVFLKLKGVE